MAKKEGQLYFTTGVNIPEKDGDGERRFEKGEKVPDDISPATLKTLKRMAAVSEDVDNG